MFRICLTRDRSIRLDTPQSSEATPSNDVEQDRFGLIITGVCGGDSRCSAPSRCIRQKSVAHGAGCRLKTAAVVFGEFSHIPGADLTDDFSFKAEISDVAGVAFSLGSAQTVVEMSYRELRCQVAGGLTKIDHRGQHRHGVWPTRNREQDGFRARDTAHRQPISECRFKRIDACQRSLNQRAEIRAWWTTERVPRRAKFCSPRRW